MGMGKKDLPAGYRNKLTGFWAVTVNYRNRRKRRLHLEAFHHRLPLITGEMYGVW